MAMRCTIVTILLVHFVNHIATDDSPQCLITLDKADKAVQKIILVSNPNAIIPRNDADLERFYCGPFPAQLRDIKKYGDECLRLFPKTLYNTIVGSLRTWYKKACKTPNGRKDMLRHYGCFKNSEMKLTQAIFNVATNYMDHIAKGIAADDSIPWFCCAIAVVNNKFDALFHATCDARTGPETTVYLNSIMRMLSGDTIDLACGKKFATVAACRQEVPHVIDHFERQPIVKLNQSLVVPLVDVLRLLDSELTADGQ